MKKVKYSLKILLPKDRYEPFAYESKVFNHTEIELEATRDSFQRSQCGEPFFTILDDGSSLYIPPTLMIETVILEVPFASKKK